MALRDQGTKDTSGMYEAMHNSKARFRAFYEYFIKDD